MEQHKWILHHSAKNCAALYEAGEKLVATATAEKRDFNDAEMADFDKQITRATKSKAYSTNILNLPNSLSAEKENIQEPTEPEGREEQEAIEIRVGHTYGKKSKISREEFAKGLNHWTRTGEIFRAFATITGSTQSGILMPTDVLPPITPAALNVFREALSATGWTLGRPHRPAISTCRSSPAPQGQQ